MDKQKLHFLQHELIDSLKKSEATTPPKWGKMNAQQMVEHLTAFFKVSSGKIEFELVTPQEHLPKFKEFLLSDKMFRENTKAPLSIIGEEALPLRYASMEAAITELQKSIDGFFDHFNADKEIITTHPVFGPLNFEEWVLLHYKHVTHHLRQFGIV